MGTQGGREHIQVEICGTRLIFLRVYGFPLTGHWLPARRTISTSTALASSLVVTSRKNATRRP